MRTGSIILATAIMSSAVTFLAARPERGAAAEHRSCGAPPGARWLCSGQSFYVPGVDWVCTAKNSRGRPTPASLFCETGESAPVVPTSAQISVKHKTITVRVGTRVGGGTRPMRTKKGEYVFRVKRLA